MKKRSTLGGLLGLLLTGLLVLAACTETEEQTPVPDSSPTPAGVQYPLTVTDMLGRSVEVPQAPVRIVSVSPTPTEMLYRVGGEAVGRDSSSDFPPETASLPEVGGAYAPSLEAIVALQPDLILMEALSQGRLLQAFEQTGAPVIAVRATSLDDVTQALTLLGTVIDRQEAASAAVSEIRSRVDAAAAPAGTPRRVLVLISDADRNIYAAKPESYAGGIAALLGQTNLAAGMPDTGPYPGFTQYSAEQAVTSDPDVIFTISPAPEPAPRLSTMLPRVPGYGGLSAVSEGRVKEVSPDLFLMAPGARIADAVEELSRLLDEAFE